MHRPFRSARLWLGLVASTALLTGCYSHTRSESSDAAILGDSATEDAATPDAPSDAGDSACRDDAAGVGGCELELGYVFRDGACFSISGCTCEGSDCATLAPTREACLEAHASCPRTCGGIVDGACLANELCDFPADTYCGGDDTPGRCIARPAECPDPGGVMVCGCDGNEYVGECAANLAGVDVARAGTCSPSPAFRTAMAERDCAPSDGPAWTITVTSDRETCDEAPPGPSVQLYVWHRLETAAPGTVYTLDGSDGSATVCDEPGAPCVRASGTISFSIFAAGEVARFHYELTTEDGRLFVGTDVEIARFWCDTGPVVCG